MPAHARRAVGGHNRAPTLSIGRVRAAFVSSARGDGHGQPCTNPTDSLAARGLYHDRRRDGDSLVAPTVSDDRKAAVL
jgi:hypothetical protein